MTRTFPPAGFRSVTASVASRPGNGPSPRNSLAHVREMSLSSSQEEYIA